MELERSLRHPSDFGKNLGIADGARFGLPGEMKTAAQEKFGKGVEKAEAGGLFEEEELAHGPGPLQTGKQIRFSYSSSLAIRIGLPS